MDTLLNLISSEQALGYATTFLAGSGLMGLGAVQKIAKRMGVKPVALVKSFFGKKKKNPWKELFELFMAIMHGKSKEKIADELIDVIEAFKPMMKERK